MLWLIGLEDGITGPLFRVSFLFIMYCCFFLLIGFFLFLMVFWLVLLPMVFLVVLLRHFLFYDFFWFVSVNENTKGSSPKLLLWKMRLIRSVVRRIRISRTFEPLNSPARML